MEGWRRGRHACRSVTWPSLLGNLPQPQITAWPGSMIPVRHPVTIRCHAAADVEMFRISQEGRPEPTDGLKAQESGEVNLTEITETAQGRTAVPTRAVAAGPGSASL